MAEEDVALVLEETAESMKKSIEHLRHDLPPPLAFALLTRPPALCPILRLLACEGLEKTRADLCRREPAAVASADFCINHGGRRVGMNQGADGVEDDAADSVQKRTGPCVHDERSV